MEVFRNKNFELNDLTLPIEKDDKVQQYITNVCKEEIKDIKIDPSKRSPLIKAMSKGDENTVEKLIEEGAPIGGRSGFDKSCQRRTALTFAANTNRVRTTCLILNRAKKDGVKYKDLHPNIAMQKACKRNSFEVGKILMEMELNYTNIYEDGREQPLDRTDKQYKYKDEEASYLHICAFYGSQEMLEALIIKQSEDVNRKDSEGNTPLHLASKNGSITCVILLLKHGAEVNEENNDSNTPLHLASLHGCTTCVTHLIENGARIDETNSKLCTPLLLAIYNAREELVYKLIRGGANVKARDSQGRTPLHIAAQRGRDILLPVLINNGADIDSKTPNEQLTPLMLACKAGSAACVKELIFRGASVNEKDRYRDDAFAIARNEKQDEVLSLVARALRGSKNFKLFDWHNVIDNKLYKSTLTMLDCLIRPEMDKNRGEELYLNKRA